MRRCLLVLAACHTPDVEAPARGAPPDNVVLDEIGLVAVADRGDAVLSAGAGVWLWPSLSGVDEPKPLLARSWTRLALAYAPNGFLAAGIDLVGDLDIARLGSHGAVLATVHLAPESGFFDVVAIDNGLLALRNDQVLVRFDANGVETGHLPTPPGELAIALVSRGGAAVVGFGAPDRGIDSVRVVAANAASWSPPLRAPRTWRAIALSPDHRRVAGIPVDGFGADVIDIASNIRLPGYEAPVEQRDCWSSIGFVDDEHVATTGDTAVCWLGGRPVAVGENVTSAARFGDGTIVFGHQNALALVSRDAGPRFLGYRELGAGRLAPAGDHAAMIEDHQLVMLDDHLAVTHVVDDDGGLGVPRPFDDRIVVLVEDRPREAPMFDPPHGPKRKPAVAGKQTISLRDSATGTAFVLGAWPKLESIDVDPSSRVIAVTVADLARRWSVAADGRPTELPPLRVPANTHVFPVDPRRANGAVAIAVEFLGDLDHPDRGMDVITMHPTGTDIRGHVRGWLLGVASDGVVWTHDDDVRDLVAYRDGVVERRVSLSRKLTWSARLSPDGSSIVDVDGNLIHLIDATGRERWQRSTRGAPNGYASAAFTGDGRDVIVSTRDRLIEMSAATGEVVATSCAWQFGLHDRIWDTDGAACQLEP